MTARVSVVVPCHDYGRFLPACVGSVLSQADVEVEVIVVDDASTDDSVQVARGIADRDYRVRVVQQQVNRGPVTTFNAGLALATGEFLVRLDADDLLTPGSLARSVAVCRRFPGVGLVYGRPVHFTGAVPQARTVATRWTVWAGSTWLEDRCRSGVNVITSPEAFMRMSVVMSVGGQRQLAHTHDMDMWLRLAAVADVAYIHGADQAWHREHPASLSRRVDDLADDLGLTMLAERRAAFDGLATIPGDRLPEGPDLARLARRTLAAESLRRAVYEYDRGRAPARPVDGLLAFAEDTYPQADGLPERRALDERTTTLGRRGLRRGYRRFAAPARRLLHDGLRARRWSRTGLYSRCAPLASVRVQTVGERQVGLGGTR